MGGSEKLPFLRQMSAQKSILGMQNFQIDACLRRLIKTYTTRETQCHKKKTKKNRFFCSLGSVFSIEKYISQDIMSFFTLSHLIVGFHNWYISLVLYQLISQNSTQHFHVTEDKEINATTTHWVERL